MSKISEAVTGASRKSCSEEHIEFLKKEGFKLQTYDNNWEYSEENVYVEARNNCFYVRICDEHDDWYAKATEYIFFDIENFYSRYDKLCDWISKNKYI